MTVRSGPAVLTRRFVPVAPDRFPILFGWGPKSLRDKEHVGVSSVPWAMLAPHERQAMLNHGQTLARLAERGGLSVVEMAALLENRKWRQMPVEDAWAIVARHMTAFAEDT